MSEADDEFESVRRESDPRRLGRRATELLAVYQQRTIELARLRRESMRRLQAEEGLSYAAVAGEFGLSKGRVGQITQSGPPVERALFGVGPVTVAVPLRSGGERALPVLLRIRAGRPRRTRWRPSGSRPACATCSSTCTRCASRSAATGSRAATWSRSAGRRPRR